MPTSARTLYQPWRIIGVFGVTTLFALLIARAFLAPTGYYGTPMSPRFSDAWFARAQTIIAGGNLYRDAETMTPPLVNLLLVPPVLGSGWFAHQNPAATLAFMLYFALFNLGTAFLLLAHNPDRRAGYAAAVVFLLNPLTTGNAILRRQDEAILVFGFALVILLMTQRRHTWASLVLGATLLIKLTAVLLIPLGLIRTRLLRYASIPLIVFGLVMAPFLLSAGVQAAFWNPTQRHAQHPFQFDGLNPIALWYVPQGNPPPIALLLFWSALFVVGIGATLIWIARRPHGIWEDLSLLLGVTLLLSPKLHCGYFALLALTLAPIAGRYKITGLVWGFGLLVLLADLTKWPTENFQLAFGMMLVAFAMLVVILKRISSAPRANDAAPPHTQLSPPPRADVVIPSIMRRRPWISAAVLAFTVGSLTAAFSAPQERFYDIGTPEDFSTAMTLFEPERRDGHTYRWTTPDAHLVLHGAYRGQALLGLRMFHQEEYRIDPPTLSLTGARAPGLTFGASTGWRVYQVLLPPDMFRSNGVATAPLTIKSDQYLPAPGDHRNRGAAIDWVTVTPMSGAPLPIGQSAYHALLLVGGLVIAWEMLRYLCIAAADGQAPHRAARRLDAGLIVLAAGLVLWASLHLPSLVWSAPLNPPILLNAVIGGCVLGSTIWTGRTRMLRPDPQR